MAAPILVPAASLPRFLAFESASSRDTRYLQVTGNQNDAQPLLAFMAPQKTRLAVHEVVFNANQQGMVMLRAANGRFWQRNGQAFIVADRESIPRNPSSDPACYFKLFRRPGGELLIQSVVDNRYLKRHDMGSPSFQLSFLRASASGSDDPLATLRDSSAVDVAVVLPRLVMFRGDNGSFVGDHQEKNIDWLKFNKEGNKLSSAHEVIPLLDGNVMMKNINLDKFWRRSPNWIWADVNNRSSAEQNKDCHFDVFKQSNTLVAFKSVANDRLLKRYSDSDWNDMLCAIGTNINEPASRLVVHEAVLSRKLSDIKYLLELAEASDIKPLVVGSGSMFNNSNFASDLEVQVTLTLEVSKSQTWSTSSTFSTSLTVGFTVGIPEVASVNGNVTVGQEHSISTELGKTSTSAVQFHTTYKVTAVPPRTEVKVTVECTTAKLRVPFTYTSKDTRIDGVDMPSVENVDGIFEGVNAFHVRGVVEQVDDKGNKTKGEAVPVSFASA